MSFFRNALLENFQKLHFGWGFPEFLNLKKIRRICRENLAILAKAATVCGFEGNILFYQKKQKLAPKKSYHLLGLGWGRRICIGCKAWTSVWFWTLQSGLLSGLCARSRGGFGSTSHPGSSSGVGICPTLECRRLSRRRNGWLAWIRRIWSWGLSLFRCSSNRCRSRPWNSVCHCVRIR